MDLLHTYNDMAGRICKMWRDYSYTVRPYVLTVEAGGRKRCGTYRTQVDADALRATVFPHEIWQHHDKKVYVRKYRKPNDDSFVMVGVVKQNGKARTYYWDAPDEVEKARQGKLVYCRTK